MEFVMFMVNVVVAVLIGSFIFYLIEKTEKGDNL